MDIFKIIILSYAGLGCHRFVEAWYELVWQARSVQVCCDLVRQARLDLSRCEMERTGQAGEVGPGG